MITLLMLLAGHAVADYPLQGDFLARAKNHTAPVTAVPWWIALAMHALIHAGAVLLITQRLDLALLEFVAHVAIDYAKCDGRLTFGQDQALHIVCKLLWWVLL